MVHPALLLEPVTTDLVSTISLQHPKTSAVRKLGRPITPSVEGRTEMPLKCVHLHRLSQISDTNWPMCKPNDRRVRVFWCTWLTLGPWPMTASRQKGSFAVYRNPGTSVELIRLDVVTPALTHARLKRSPVEGCRTAGIGEGFIDATFHTFQPANIDVCTHVAQ